MELAGADREFLTIAVAMQRVTPRDTTWLFGRSPESSRVPAADSKNI